MRLWAASCARRGRRQAGGVLRHRADRLEPCPEHRFREQGPIGPPGRATRARADHTARQWSGAPAGSRSQRRRQTDLTRGKSVRDRPSEGERVAALAGALTDGLRASAEIGAPDGFRAQPRSSRRRGESHAFACRAGPRGQARFGWSVGRRGHPVDAAEQTGVVQCGADYYIITNLYKSKACLIFTREHRGRSRRRPRPVGRSRRPAGSGHPAGASRRAFASCPA